MLAFDVFRDDAERFFSYHYQYQDGLTVSAFESNETRYMVRSLPVYSKENLIAKTEKINGDGINIGNSFLTYSTRDKSITETTRWIGAKTKTKVISFYDDEGKLVKQVNYEATLPSPFSTKAETVMTYEYNDKGLIILENRYNPWGITEDYEERLDLTMKNEYDEKGHLISSQEFDKNGEIKASYSYQYKLDSQNNWLEKLELRDGEKESLIKRVITYFGK
jgi:hypothetical protein